MHYKNARLFIILFVSNFGRVCSQFWLSDLNSRGNPSLRCVGRGGGQRGATIVNNYLVKKLRLPICIFAMCGWVGFSGPISLDIAMLLLGYPIFKRGQTCTFQTCTLFSARVLALTTSRLPSMPSSPPLLSIASTLSELKWAITSPKKGQAMQRCHEEQSARSKGARLSPLDISRDTSSGRSALPHNGAMPTLGVLSSHRHSCAIRHFATYRAIIVRYVANKH